MGYAELNFFEVRSSPCCMAQPSQKSTHRPLRLLDKGRRLFRNISTPSDLQRITDVTLSSPATTSQKKFKKSNDARHDISVLAMTYLLQDNPTIKELIRLIISLDDREDDKVWNP